MGIAGVRPSQFGQGPLSLQLAICGLTSSVNAILGILLTFVVASAGLAIDDHTTSGSGFGICPGLILSHNVRSGARLGQERMCEPINVVQSKRRLCCLVISDGGKELGFAEIGGHQAWCRPAFGGGGGPKERNRRVACKMMKRHLVEGGGNKSNIVNNVIDTGPL
jgi:hypothetical protein